jgi:ABC-type thiamine transport system substrate-binding protein
MYIENDMSGWTTGDEPKTAALVKAFAQFVLSEEAQDMLPEFGFVAPPLLHPAQGQDRRERHRSA